MGIERIQLGLLSSSPWEYIVSRGNGDNVWEEFYAQFIECQGHYILVGRKYGKSRDFNVNLSNGAIRGVAHSPDEAKSMLVAICREEAERMRKRYESVKRDVEIWDHLSK